MDDDILRGLYVEQELNLNLDPISPEEAEEIINEIMDDSQDREIEPDTVFGEGFFEDGLHFDEQR